jgi:AraC-like DNA-binding protein
VVTNMSAVHLYDFNSFGSSSSDGHEHAGAILLRSGAGEFSLKRKFTLRAGELYVIPAGAPHAFFGALEDHTEGWIFQLSDDFNRLNARNAVAALQERRSADLSAWLERIHTEQRDGSACSVALSEALYRAVHIECARAMGIATCAQYSPLVTNALQVVRSEFATALRPRDIASRVGVTAAHLSHEVKRQTGRSPSEWIAHTRIEAAKLRLLSSRDTVSDIAESVGYADVSQLNRQFRHALGLSPQAWRQANANKARKT